LYSMESSSQPKISVSQAVQVCVRIRPCGVNLGDAAYEGQVVDHDDHNCQIEGTALGPFSAIIPTNMSQDSVYSSLIDPFINSFINGINCTMFMYG